MRLSVSSNDFASSRDFDLGPAERRARQTKAGTLRHKALASIAIAFATIALSSTVHAQPVAGTGDLDGSGTLDTADVGLMVKFVSGETAVTLGDLETSDLAPLNAADEEVRANDLSLLIRALTDPDVDGDGLSNDFELGIGTSPFASDSDGDGLDDGFEYNAGYSPDDPDTDGDGLDDGFEYHAGYLPDDPDSDGDEIWDGVDNCVLNQNQPQTDDDEDGHGNECDNCPGAFNPGQIDTDADEVGDECDICMRTSNAGQADGDDDGFGDLCDTESACISGTSGDDPDRDFICGASDPCPNWPNSDWPQDPSLCLCGDIDNTGQVSSTDLTAYDEYLATGDRSHVVASHKCDIDGDGICTRGDRDFVAELVNNQIPLPTPGLCADYRHVEDHVLSRIGFGTDLYSRHLIREIGVDAYIGEQLDPESIPDPDYGWLKQQYGPGGTPFPTLDPAQATGLKNMNFLHTEYGNAVARTRFDLSEMKLLRAIYSKRQLEAVMLDVMFNHMNVDATSGWFGLPYATIMHYEKAIEDTLFGPFEHMIQASAESAAMLDYLDQQRSTATSINENYGREIMELHTVGADTYDQDTVVAASKILTGYQLNYVGVDWDNSPGAPEIQPDWHFQYDPAKHSAETKVIVIDGITWTFTGARGRPFEQPSPAPASKCIVGNSGNQGEVFICHLSRHPKTAERISKLLTNRFVSEDLLDPEVAQLIASAANVYLTPNAAGEIGSLHSTLEHILASPLFRHATYFRGKAKRPFVSIASTFRALGHGSEGYSDTRDASAGGRPADFRSKANFRGDFISLELMDETLYEAGPPTGYDTNSSSAVSSGSVLARGNSARDFVMTQWGSDILETHDVYPILGIPGSATNEQIVDVLVDRFLPGGIRQRTIEPVDTSTRQLIIDSLYRTDWETLDRKARRAATMLLSSPEFLLH